MKNTSKEAYLERLRNLSNINKSAIKESTNRTLGTLIDYRRAADGVAYGIIKESHNYYIKRGGIKSDPNVSDFAYIGGLSNITNFQYKSLSEASKNRNMLMQTIVGATSLKPNINGGRKSLNEDMAGQEIDNAIDKFDDLEAATAAEKTQDDSGQVDMEAGLDAEPSANPEMPALEPEPAPEGGDVPAPESDDMSTEEPAPEDDTEMPTDEPAPEGGDATEIDEPIKELEKNIGKITNTIRKTELEPVEVKSFVNSFLSAFKDKFTDIDIEDRKEMANRILKVVPPEDVEALGNDMSGDEIEEEKCSECGSFATYAESMGYGTADSLMECGEEEVTNLISGYANAHNDGMNDGDPEGVSTVIKAVNPEMLNTLKGDYGHDEYAEKLTPYVDSMNEATEEESIQKLQELFGGLGKLFNAGKKKVGQAATGVANAVGTEFSDIGTAVKDQYGKAKDSVVKGYNDASKAVGQAATDIKQTYHSGEVAGEIKKLESIATNLGAQILALNTRLEKAGQQPIDKNKILAGLSNQLRSKDKNTMGVPNVGATKAGMGIQRENTDPANVITQPMNEDDDIDDTEEGTEEIGFAPASQSLGAALVKPSGAPTTISLESNSGTKVDVSLNEILKQLRAVVAESKKPSADLSKKEKSAVVKKAEAGEDIGKKGKGFEKVAKKAAKEYDSKEAGEKVAAAAMWKNIKKEGEDKGDELMTESELKVRKYVRARLEEKAGHRKPSLNENEKSDTLKRLDELIDKQLKSYKSVINK